MSNVEACLDMFSIIEPTCVGLSAPVVRPRPKRNPKTIEHPRSTSPVPLGLFGGLPDTTPSSEPLALAILSFIVSRGGRAGFWQIYNHALGPDGTTDELVGRRYEYRVALGLTALTLRGLIYPISPFSEYPYVYYRVSYVGKQISKEHAVHPLNNIMKELDAMRGQTQQTTFLSGTDIVLPRSQANKKRSAATPRETPPPKQAIKAKRRVAQVTLKDMLGRSFNPADLIDERERVAVEVVRRRGQDRFRELLLTLYGGRCAITGCDAVDALEAAHIVRYKGEKSNHPANGLLLRADLHSLFDLGLFAIDTRDMTVIVAPLLQETAYRELHNLRLTLPGGDYHISVEALDMHRAWAEQRWPSLVSANLQSPPQAPRDATPARE